MEPRYSIEPIQMQNASEGREMWKLALATGFMLIAFALGFLFH